MPAQETLTVISPIDSSKFLEIPFATTAEIDAVLQRSVAAFQSWRKVPIAERVAIARRFTVTFGAKEGQIVDSIVKQMGRPVRYAAGEITGTVNRAHYMASIAEESLRDLVIGENSHMSRMFIRREPLGPIFIIATWNYPYLTMVNGVVPALLAGNTVVLKHSPQTPLCAEIFATAFREAGLPDDVLQVVHVTDEGSEYIVKHPSIAFVNFTGSVAIGKKIHAAASCKLIGEPESEVAGVLLKYNTGMELGGKDPAYVLFDCDLNYTVKQLVDGAFFNSGQCCCAIERIYVHEAVYDEFVNKFVDATKGYVLGDPTDKATTIGPMSHYRFAETVRKHLRDAREYCLTLEAIASYKKSPAYSFESFMQKGAKALIDTSMFPADKGNTTYVAPQVLVDVNHTMLVMTEETFGPIVGIMRVSSDDEAVHLMNDSRYGLTASIWTSDLERAIAIGDRIETGTCFMNRCDYLDPALPWVGAKESGKGVSLSRLAFEQLTRPKSFNLNIETPAVMLE
ncbi:aldehyde dehydrogenase [Endogone sp. FLAS-F59071]|nr:aldehyde dehydrogenase [Endogone sp. FLAS-F59071]|eukprot:RUS20057.1 aldehyde dehydrogenase [Endogone sp. FLAS-F59071]